jgi:hypothetical protein
MAIEGVFKTEANVISYTPGAAKVSGQIEQMDDGRAGVVVDDTVISTLGAAAVSGIFDILCVYTTTFTAGDEVWWDYSSNVAIAASSAILEDFYLGRCLTTKASGPTYVRVILNAPRMPQAQGLIQSRVYEFDCETGVDAAVHTLIPAEWNKNGLLILGCYGRVTEQFAGTEDQGIVTIKDTAGSPATIATLTASNAGADAVGDIIVGAAMAPVFGSATGTLVA